MDGRLQAFAAGVDVSEEVEAHLEPRARPQVGAPPKRYAPPAVRILKPEVIEAPPSIPESDVEPVPGPRDADASPRSAPRRHRVLGVNISDGIAHLAVLEATGSPRLELADRVAPPRDVDDASRLATFAAEIGRMLSRTDVGMVAVARPERYTNWTYTDAFDRISLETCIMLEAHAHRVRYESVGQNHAANVIGLPLARVSELLSSRLGIQKTKSWSDRWPAVLVALATRAP